MEELKRKLLEVINTSGLPLEAAFYVVKDVYRDMAEFYNNALKEQERVKAQQQAELLAKQQQQQEDN